MYYHIKRGSLNFWADTFLDTDSTFGSLIQINSSIQNPSEYRGDIIVIKLVQANIKEKSWHVKLI